MPSARPAPRPTAFTLLELLVVLALIVVLLGLLFPALSIARRSARSAETKTLMNSISTGIQSFKADTNRSPGFFSARAMGSQNNGGVAGSTTLGFTQMENAMLELAGGLITEEEFNNSGGLNAQSLESLQFPLSIGPGGEETAYIRPAQMGTADSGSYVALSANVLRPIELIGPFNNATNYYPLAQNNIVVDGINAGRFSSMRYVFDAFDRPLLLWSADPLARFNLTESDSSIAGADVFAQDFSPANAATGRRGLFYWGSNTGILRMNTIGRQRDTFNAVSLLGRANTNITEGDRAGSLEALLGNPAFRTRDAVSGAPGANRIMPLRPLGNDIIMSAGPNGAFAEGGENLRGIRFFFDPSGNAPLGANTTVSQIDDIIIATP